MLALIALVPPDRSARAGDSRLLRSARRAFDNGINDVLRLLRLGFRLFDGSRPDLSAVIAREALGGFPPPLDTTTERAVTAAATWAGGAVQSIENHRLRCCENHETPPFVVGRGGFDASD